jgi:hypothetical protein
MEALLVQACRDLRLLNAIVLVKKRLQISGFQSCVSALLILDATCWPNMEFHDEISIKEVMLSHLLKSNARVQQCAFRGSFEVGRKVIYIRSVQACLHESSGQPSPLIARIY